VRRIRSRSLSLGLIPLILSQVVLIGGCGSNSSELAASQPPPKNQAEGLRRLQEANAKHDESAPTNQRSGATKN
jgi:hypothetical protein